MFYSHKHDKLLLMKLFFPCLLLTTSFVFASCNSSNSPKKQEQLLVADTTAKSDVNDSQLAFPLPDIPADILDPKARATYLVKHFWDKFDFSDSSSLSNPEALENSFANFVGIAVQFVPESADGDIAVPIQRADERILPYFMELYEKYLYHPRSPMVNEELYIPVLNAALKSSKLDYASQVRLKERLDMLKKNRIGQIATDFVYELSDASRHRLHSNFAPLTLLVFYSSSCESCDELIETLKADKELEQWVASKSLLLLMIDSESHTHELWQRSLDKMPEFARVGYDTGNSINNERLYELKSIPSIYLLGSSNKVLRKGVQYHIAKGLLRELIVKAPN